MDTEPNLLELPLESTGLTGINAESVRSITDFLHEKLPESDKGAIEEGLNWNYVLEKHRTNKSKCKKLVKKKKFLTRKEKKSLGLTKLPKEDWDYSKLLKMNEMWCAYMMGMLNHPTRIPKSEDVDYQNFCSVLNKAELVGNRCLGNKVYYTVGYKRFKAENSNEATLCLQDEIKQLEIYNVRKTFSNTFQRP